MRRSVVGLIAAAVAGGVLLASQMGVAQRPGRGASGKTKAQAKSFRDCAECPEMVRIPAGVFAMGASSGEAKGFVGEGPQRRVEVKAFAVGRFDVTRGEWTRFVKATARPTRTGCGYSGLPKEESATASWEHLGFAQDDRHPVVCVTFGDALDYAGWLTKTTGHRYRLMSEAEWEYAARAGTTTAYPWGGEASHEFANYGGDDRPGPGVAQGRDKWVGTSPVGSFAANGFGLYDMNGNVMQWVQDCFAMDYADHASDGTAFVRDRPVTGMSGALEAMNGTRSCAYRMLRGGDWGDPPAMIRSAFRNFAPSLGQTLATYRSAGLGIRLAREE